MPQWKGWSLPPVGTILTNSYLATHLVKYPATAEWHGFAMQTEEWWIGGVRAYVIRGRGMFDKTTRMTDRRFDAALSVCRNSGLTPHVMVDGKAVPYVEKETK